MKKINFLLLCVTFVSSLFLISCQKQETQSVPISEDSTYLKNQKVTQKLLDSLTVILNLKDSANQTIVASLNKEVGDLQNTISTINQSNAQVLSNRVIADSATANNSPLNYYPNFIEFTYDSLGYLKTSILYNNTETKSYHFIYKHYFTDTTVVQIGIAQEIYNFDTKLYHVLVTKITKYKSLKAYNVSTYIVKPKEIRLY